jgi:argininosuccinate synthase
MKQIIKILTDMIARKVFGELTIKIQKGKIVYVGKNESIILEK